MNTEIEEFAKNLIEWVRDDTIRMCDATFQGKHAKAERWRKAAASCATPEEFAAVIIPDIVDSTIAGLLDAIDQEVLRLSFTASTGKHFDLVTATDGLSGLYGGEWCKQYTKERYIDDFADLRNFFANYFDKHSHGDGK